MFFTFGFLALISPLIRVYIDDADSVYGAKMNDIEASSD